MSLHLGSDMLSAKIDQILKPGPAHRPVQPLRKRVETFTEFFNSVSRASLERALSLHLGRHVDEPHFEARWHLLAARGEVGFDSRLAGGDAQNAKALHRSKVDIRRTAQLRRTIGQD